MIGQSKLYYDFCKVCGLRHCTARFSWLQAERNRIAQLKEKSDDA
jgi:hypothetical protein